MTDFKKVYHILHDSGYHMLLILLTLYIHNSFAFYHDKYLRISMIYLRIGL